MRILKLACMALLSCLILAGCALDNKTADTPAAEKTPPQEVAMAVPEKGIPVLMYHMIGDVPDNDAVLLESHFREQMKFLKDNDFHPLTMDQLYDYLAKGKPVPVRPVVLTFDDGYPDTYRIVMPILKEYGFAGTVFVPTYDTDQGTRINWQQVKEMQASGLTIASHSYHHERATEMTGNSFADEVKKSQAELKEQLGITNEYFCYPYGGYTREACDVLKAAGIKMAVTMDPGWAKYGDNLYAVKRIWIGNAVDIENFKQRVTTPQYEER